jgi:hypothetical protein
MIRAIHLRAPNRSSRSGGHLEDKICDEEDARAEAERGLRQAKVLVHRERGKAHIHPVQIGDEVADDQERHQSLGDLRNGTDFYSVHGIGPTGLHLANI